jgi:cytochrome oxidase complex assembly protein 1
MSQQVQRRGWWGRNWFWVVPVGCLAPLVVCGGGITLIFAVAFGALKSSDANKQAVALAREHPAVQAALGTPITEGAFTSGALNVNNNAGDADLQIPLSGPKGSGSLHAVASLAGGKWTFSSLVLDVAGSGEHIDVLATEPHDSGGK